MTLSVLTAQSDEAKRFSDSTEGPAADGIRRLIVRLPSLVTDPSPPTGTQLRKPFDKSTVAELQGFIEEAFTFLSQANEASDAAGAYVILDDPAQLPAVERKPTVVRKWLVRASKTAVGLAVAFVVGVLPVQKLLLLTSVAAIVNGPVLTIRARIDGRIGAAGLPGVGSTVQGNLVVGHVEGNAATAGATPAFATDIASPRTGRVWEVLAQPGEQVLTGQPLFRVVDCGALAVTATVPESVYNNLIIGSPARFDLYDSDASHRGTVANLTGQSAPAANYAIPPATLAGDAFRVTIAVPGLDFGGDCPVGRHGEVVFDGAPG
jgi:hypothetical protein